MARKQPTGELLTDDDLAAAFLADDYAPEPTQAIAPQPAAPAPQPAVGEQQWDEEEELPGQLAVDAYETDELLVVKARTAGVDRSDLDVSLSDGILTISGTLSSGDETDVKKWHIQECYWGEFSRTIALPVAVKEDEVKAELKDGVLTISFAKVEKARSITIDVL